MSENGMERWVSVNEQPPEEERQVFIYAYSDFDRCYVVRCGLYKDGKWYEWGGHNLFRTLLDVTHWMPMPLKMIWWY